MSKVFITGLWNKAIFGSLRIVSIIKHLRAHLVYLKHRVREYWMIYRGPGFLAVVWFVSFPPFSVSKLDRRRTGRLWKRDTLLTGEGWMGRRSTARNLVLYKSFKTLCRGSYTGHVLVKEGRKTESKATNAHLFVSIYMYSTSHVAQMYRYNIL